MKGRIRERLTRTAEIHYSKWFNRARAINTRNHVRRYALARRKKNRISNASRKANRPS